MPKDKKILLCHDMEMSVADALRSFMFGWEIKTVSPGHLLQELCADKYQVLLLDVIRTSVFDGQAQFADIDRCESWDGDLMMMILALRLRALYPQLPIVMLRDSSVHGDDHMLALMDECLVANIKSIDIFQTEEVVSAMEAAIA